VLLIPEEAGPTMLSPRVRDDRARYLHCDGHLPFFLTHPRAEGH
jgi:hypothetical protein